MKHELIIHCFGQWWKGDAEDDCYELLVHNVGIIVSPQLRFNAKIIYDKTANKLIENKSGTSAEQIQMEVWMLGDLPFLNTERRALDRKRKSYERALSTEQAVRNLLDNIKI